MPSFHLLLIYTFLPFSILSTINISQAAQSESPIIGNEKFKTCLDTLGNSATFSNIKSVFNQYRPVSGDSSVLKALNYILSSQKSHGIIWLVLSMNRG